MSISLAGKKIFMAAFFLLAPLSISFAEMRVELLDGRSFSVPVNKQDIRSISFEETSGGATGSAGIAWNFETGDLNGWTAVGEAFSFQPTYGDNPTGRHRGQPSQHQGDYWIGGYEKRPVPADPAGQVQGDGPQGTLTSDSFSVSSSFISFLIGGGCDMNTVRAELLVDGQAVLQATGKCTETMERMRWNVSPFRGKTAQIRLVDASSGGWGHINFDDVLFE